ncbi:MAG: lytic transglycosylase domain-containing protein [Rubrivivax sp.]
MKTWLWLAALLAGSAAQATQQTEFWGYVDGHGVAHVASRPLDARYQLVLGASGTKAGFRVPGKTDGAARLVTWLDIAPEAKALGPWLREAGREHGVDPDLLKAVIAVESGFDAQAVSPRGAIGLMQITPVSGDRYATDDERATPAEQRLRDARTNIRTGARMLADLMRRHPRIDLALAAWNAGEGTLRRHGGELPPIEETRAHVHLVLEVYWALLQRSQVQRATRLKVQ